MVTVWAAQLRFSHKTLSLKKIVCANRLYLTCAISLCILLPMSTTFTHKEHSVEIVNDRSQNALTYIVMIDGEYVGDINNTMNVAIDQAKAFINRMEKREGN
jgi:hypothetical protein